MLLINIPLERCILIHKSRPLNVNVFTLTGCYTNRICLMLSVIALWFVHRGNEGIDSVLKTLKLDQLHKSTV